MHGYRANSLIPIISSYNYIFVIKYVSSRLAQVARGKAMKNKSMERSEEGSLMTALDRHLIRIAVLNQALAMVALPVRLSVGLLRLSQRCHQSRSNVSANPDWTLGVPFSGLLLAETVHNRTTPS